LEETHLASTGDDGPFRYGLIAGKVIIIIFIDPSDFGHEPMRRFAQIEDREGSCELGR
jgi:hypothetical protein